MILSVDQHQTHFHLTFPASPSISFVCTRCASFNAIRTDPSSLLLRQNRPASPVSVRIRQATRLSGVDDKPHHHFFSSSASVCVSGILSRSIIHRSLYSYRHDYPYRHRLKFQGVTISSSLSSLSIAFCALLATTQRADKLTLRYQG